MDELRIAEDVARRIAMYMRWAHQYMDAVFVVEIQSGLTSTLFGPIRTVSVTASSQCFPARRIVHLRYDWDDIAPNTKRTASELTDYLKSLTAPGEMLRARIRAARAAAQSAEMPFSWTTQNC